MEKSRLSILHHSLYEFSSPVFLEPHIFRFKPKNIPFREVISFSLAITPEPIRVWQNRSADDNIVHFAWFAEATDRLEIKAESLVTAIPYDRFGFIIYPHECNVIPFTYPADYRNALQNFLNPISGSEEIVSFTEHIKHLSNHETLQFCIRLTQQIHHDFVYAPRKTGDPLLPDEMLKIKNGSCRDFSYFQMAILRNAGLAARFVSGYHYNPANENHDLHAWVEVYFAGAGWIGFDATTGLATDHLYFPVACSASPVNSMPVSGTIRGNAGSKLSTFVKISSV